VAYVKRLLEEVGTNPDRVEMYNLSSAMGGRFAEIVEEMTAKIKGLGPAEAEGPAGDGTPGDRQKEPQKV